MREIGTTGSIIFSISLSFFSGLTYFFLFFLLQAGLGLGLYIFYLEVGRIKLAYFYASGHVGRCPIYFFISNRAGLGPWWSQAYIYFITSGRSEIATM